MDTMLYAFALVFAVDAMARRWDFDGRNSPENPDDYLPWGTLQDVQESSNKRNGTESPERKRLLDWKPAH
jgi:hypothetical protein